ncbi:MAG: hypothetical protein U1E76_26365 [Planctomycetota bacterium]
MKAAVLATASVPTIKLALAQVRKHFGAAQVIVYLRDSFRAELEPHLQGFEVRSDRIRGRWLKMIRALRSERFDLAFVIFAGGSDHWKMKLVAFLTGARSLFVCNESGDFFEWNRSANLPTIRQHLAWRLTAREAEPAGSLPWAEPLLRLVKRLYSLHARAAARAPVLDRARPLLEIGRARGQGKSGAPS